MNERAVREALEVMSCEVEQRKNAPVFLPRLEATIRPLGYWWKICEVAFIGECKAYLREKGWNEFKTSFFRKKVALVCINNDDERGIAQSVEIRGMLHSEECECYAEAVLAAHGAETKEGEG